MRNRSTNKPLGVLISNIGTPKEPTTKEVRRYLKQFLSDPRVIDLNRALWWCILNGIVLRTRPAKSAEMYRKVWMVEGSPLMVITRSQANALQSILRKRLPTQGVHVEVGMRYGEPSIEEALNKLQANGCEKVVILPMFPQYSATTTASVLDAVAAAYKKQRNIPELHFIRQHHEHPFYIRAMADNLRDHWKRNGRSELLLISYHGIPKRYADLGDPYPNQCRTTTDLLVRELGLKEDEYRMCFQSRFGREEWLKPYTDETLEAWGKQGVRSVDVIAPAFSADCLETLEELAQTNQELFAEAGGEKLHYIPTLNATPLYMEALADTVFARLETQQHERVMPLQAQP